MRRKKCFFILLALTFLCPMAGFGGDGVTDSGMIKSKSYDEYAKKRYSENDVKAFVYEWFAGFDHQADKGFFEKHLNPQRIDMLFPGRPVKSIENFRQWYANVIDTIQWNKHKISDLEVSGDEINGFSVGFNVHWTAKSYTGEVYEMNLHQDWKVEVDAHRNFIIVKHEAREIEKNGGS